MADVELPVSGTLRSGNASGPVFAVFLYWTASPHTVYVLLANGQLWPISRQLLVNGLYGAAGHPDDLLITCAGGEVLTRFRTKHGHLTVVWPYAQIHNALATTAALVPLGTETTDWDAGLARLGGAR